MKHLLILLLFLTACSTTASPSTQNNVIYGKLKLKSDQDLTAAIVNASIYKIKANVLEEIPNLRNAPNFTIYTKNNESYRTKNFCLADTICNLKVDKIGKQNATIIDTQYFKIEIQGEVRQPIFCISYKGFTLRNVSLNPEGKAIQIDTPQDKKQTFDRCFISQNASYKLNYEGSGEYDVKTFSTYTE